MLTARHDVDRFVSAESMEIVTLPGRKVVQLLMINFKNAVAVSPGIMSSEVRQPLS